MLWRHFFTVIAASSAACSSVADTFEECLLDRAECVDPCASSCRLSEGIDCTDGYGVNNVCRRAEAGMCDTDHRLCARNLVAVTIAQCAEWFASELPPDLCAEDDENCQVDFYTERVRERYACMEPIEPGDLAECELKFGPETCFNSLLLGCKRTRRPDGNYTVESGCLDDPRRSCRELEAACIQRVGQ